NNDDAVTGSRDVTISFDAVDPTSPAGQSTTGVQQFCIVRYYYDGRLRRWVEERCDFRSLPAGNNGNFSVNARLPVREGVAYAFVWVKDGAGNISTTPGFDFINFIPTGTELRLERNDIRVFRLRLNVGQSVSLTFTPTNGDVDATVFQGITNPVR